MSEGKVKLIITRLLSRNLKIVLSHVFQFGLKLLNSRDLLRVEKKTPGPQNKHPSKNTLCPAMRKGFLGWTRHKRSLELSPCPSLAPVMASLALPKPSSRHTTLADTRFQLSSQTVPHSPFFSTSTRPSPVLAPPFSLTRGCWKTQKWR